MKKIFFSFFLFIQVYLFGDLYVGVSSENITPPIGTPSAGYRSREGAGMQGVRDLLFATAMAIDNCKDMVVFCGVDHLGFDFKMVEEVRQLIKEKYDCRIFIGSSHTHSGGGAYLSYPILGKALSGKFDPEIRQFYIEGVAKAIFEAIRNKKPAKIGIGYGKLKGKNCYRGKYPNKATPREDVTIIKAVNLDDKPIGVIYNYTAHPTTLPYSNLLFSADFIGDCRKLLEEKGIFSVFFNGAQGDVNPVLTKNDDFEKNCQAMGTELASEVLKIWENTSVKGELKMDFYSYPYKFNIIFPKWIWLVRFLLPKEYQSELNLIVFDKVYAFLTIPGELSCVYDQRLQNSVCCSSNFKKLTIFGLTNDAHGYILLPEAYDLDRAAAKSFGGREYGDYVFNLAKSLLERANKFQKENKL